MTRSYCLKTDYFDIKPIGDGRYYVHFSVIDKIQDDVEIRYFSEVVLNHVPDNDEITELESNDIEKHREYKKQDVRNYASTELKFVSINGQDVWYDSEKRTSIVRSIEAERNLGQTVTNLEVNGHIYTLSIDSALSLMDNIDKYSKDCYINTIRHENAIESLTALSDIMDYVYTTGYPEKPEFNI